MRNIYICVKQVYKVAKFYFSFDRIKRLSAEWTQVEVHTGSRENGGPDQGN